MRSRFAFSKFVRDRTLNEKVGKGYELAIYKRCRSASSIIREIQVIKQQQQTDFHQVAPKNQLVGATCW
jgi:hypothetical protein